MALGRDEMLLVCGTAAATLALRQLLSNCTCPAAPSEPPLRTDEIRPPFPAAVVALLRSSALCYLSTIAEGAPHLSLMNFTYIQCALTSHRPAPLLLSLAFPWLLALRRLGPAVSPLPPSANKRSPPLRSEEKIIMSTRRDTQKFVALLDLPRVALLLHDFPADLTGREADSSSTDAKAKDTAAPGYSKTYSITCVYYTFEYRAIRNTTLNRAYTEHVTSREIE